MSEQMIKEEAVKFFGIIFRGEHNIPLGSVKEFGRGWSCNYIGDLATFDGSMLTAIVFLAHDMRYRASIEPSNPRHLKIVIFKRRADGSMSERHPNLQEAVDTWNGVK